MKFELADLFGPPKVVRDKRWRQKCCVHDCKNLAEVEMGREGFSKGYCCWSCWNEHSKKRWSDFVLFDKKGGVK